METTRDSPISEQIEYMEFLKLKEILTADEVAFVLGCNTKTIYDYANYRGLPGTQPNGRTWYFRFSKVAEWSESDDA